MSMHEEPQKKNLSDTIIEQGDDFAIDAMEDYDARIQSGEFANLTYGEIRQIYLNEAIELEEHLENLDMLRQQDEREERENDD